MHLGTGVVKSLVGSRTSASALLALCGGLQARLTDGPSAPHAQNNRIALPRSGNPNALSAVTTENFAQCLSVDFEHLIFERIQIFPLSIWKSEHQQTALRTLEFKTSANSSTRQLRSTAIPALGELHSQSVKYSSSIRSNIFYRTVLVTDTVVFNSPLPS